MEEEVAPGSVADLMIGQHVEILVDQPGWVVVLFGKAGGASVLVGEGHH